MDKLSMQTGVSEMTAILDETLNWIARPDNEFLWSSWRNVDQALGEVEQYRTEIHKGDYTHIPELHLIFAPTGPLQELSIDSGWGEKFLALAERFDHALDRLMEAGHKSNGR
jgi:hypothetical protein